MSAPVVTGEHRRLVVEVVRAAWMREDDKAAQLIAESEARAVAQQADGLCMMHADERDQLRAEVERLTGVKGTLKENWSVTNTRAEKAEAELHALRLVCGTTDANKFETAMDREREKVRVLREVLTLIHQRLAPGWLPDWIYRDLCAVLAAIAATEQPKTEAAR